MNFIIGLLKVVAIFYVVTLPLAIFMFPHVKRETGWEGFIENLWGFISVWVICPRYIIFNIFK